jgi:spoIIIJ-associated protein
VEARNEERRSVVASGKSVGDAVDNGLTMLGVRREQVDVEILSEGSRGVLGFGAENARVRLLVKPPPSLERDDQPLSAPMSSESIPAPEVPPVQAPAADVPKRVEPESPEGVGDATAVGREILSDILTLMGITAEVNVEVGTELADEGEPAPMVLNITGDDLGILIGRRGETLRTLQYLVRLMISHRLKQWTDLLVDVEHYRIRRRRALDSLAKRVADEVAKEGRTKALEPMPAYERRLVHISLRNHPHVTTHSVGEGERRKVTIIPKQ